MPNKDEENFENNYKGNKDIGNGPIENRCIKFYIFHIKFN
jgi:hypothetical protein